MRSAGFNNAWSYVAVAVAGFAAVVAGFAVVLVEVFGLGAGAGVVAGVCANDKNPTLETKARVAAALRTNLVKLIIGDSSDIADIEYEKPSVPHEIYSELFHGGCELKRGSETSTVQTRALHIPT